MLTVPRQTLLCLINRTVFSESFRMVVFHHQPLFQTANTNVKRQIFVFVERVLVAVYALNKVTNSKVRKGTICSFCMVATFTFSNKNNDDIKKF